MEVGENLMDAVVREIKEESGIDASVTYLVGVCSNTSKWIVSYYWYYCSIM